jgi:cysteine desulfurase/selenocysteine lyase
MQTTIASSQTNLVCEDKIKSPFSAELMEQIRDSFYYVDHCPYAGKRIFFENAGGSLTLKSVVQKTEVISCIPDNEHRNNPASKELSRIVAKGKDDLKIFFGASNGVIFGGETGTECLFRLIRSATLVAPEGSSILSSSVEHPATYSATQYWANKMNMKWLEVPFHHGTGMVRPKDYESIVRPDTRVATIIHTSPVTGMAMDIHAIAKVIRNIAPECFIIVDGIQHAPHGYLDTCDYGIDAYVISLYKSYSKFNNGYAWVSDRMSSVPHEQLIGKSENEWELGSRDPSALAAASEVSRYLCWLGSHFTDSIEKRPKLVAAGNAMKMHEQCLVHQLLYGNGSSKGLCDYKTIEIVGGENNSVREGVVSFSVKGVEAKTIVAEFGDRNIRIHARSNDVFSGNILNPLNLESVSRVSLAHYNSSEEVNYFLEQLEEILQY